MTDGIRYSSDRGELDRELVHRWLSEHAYWALGRPRAVQDAAIDASRNYGAYDGTSGSPSDNGSHVDPASRDRKTRHFASVGIRFPSATSGKT